MKFRYLRLRLPATALLTVFISQGTYGLSLADAMRVAEREAPSLAAQMAQVEAARNNAIPAGELPDPKLLLGLQNYPINGPDRGQLHAMPMTSTKIGVMQQMLNGDKRRARVDSAQASVERARIEQQVQRLRVRRETAMAWISTLALEQKLILFKTLYHENHLFNKAVQARLASGDGETSDSIVPQIEAAQLDEQQDQLHQELAQQRAALRRWVGVRANEQLTGQMPDWPVDAQHYKHNLEQHPELAAYTSMTSKAQALLREAQAEKKSDWSWEVAYQNREKGFGDMVSLQLSIDLPVFSGSRQDPKIAARRAELSQVEAEREAQVRMHNQQLEDDLASYQRLDRALTRNQKTLIPLAKDKVKLSMADYRAARNSLSTVINARQELIAAQLKQIDIQQQRALTSARLYFTDMEAGL
ncbi:TolC family protein [Pseudomonas sp. EL_65y_Pfl2_R95]|uniref:TolC family protein n=1 Tax=Pseudomonas sp. EL_65y_Pfl2_R95 TaxID=3088698 RepID=UPI0030D76254